MAVSERALQGPSHDGAHLPAVGNEATTRIGVGGRVWVDATFDRQPYHRHIRNLVEMIVLTPPSG